MRLAWYTGVSTGLAITVVLSAFHQRANFYSAMVYLAQSNFCLLVLVNFVYIIYGMFIFGLQRLCFGSLRAVEVEQLSDRAWIAITETCLAMTIFREEIGAWFLVMFTALVTGKVWGWIGDGRLEVLEQQPPTNPRLFHTRLVVSLLMSTLYDFWILHYSINTVIQQARPNMMVMFLFEFAVLATCSVRTNFRYLLQLAESKIVASQTQKRLEERRREVQEQREDMIRQREAAAAEGGEGGETSNEPLPNPDEVDEIDIEVPGWEAKGQWVLTLELVTDFIKLAIYLAFFSVLLMFYGLPVHIMRDLYLTGSAFFKRLSALLKYRKAIQSMKRYPDATAEDLIREDTCIICREEMRPWNPEANSGAVERSRPKKLPCGHILHFGCLKSWLERQQVCPTCRSPVTQDGHWLGHGQGQGQGQGQNGGDQNQNQNQNQNRPPQQAVPPQGQGHNQDQQQPPLPPRDGAGAEGDQDGPAPGGRGPNHRRFNLGPFRLEFIRHDARNPQALDALLDGRVEGHTDDGDTRPAGHAGHVGHVGHAGQTGTNAQQQLFGPAAQLRTLTPEFDQLVQRELASLQSLQNMQQELQTAQLLITELVRLRQLHQHQTDPLQAALAAQGMTATNPSTPLSQGAPPIQQTRTPPPQAMPQMPLFPQMPQMPQMPHMPQVHPMPQRAGYTPFPSYPYRNSTPSITRHSAPSTTAAIPAGSTDLPEGVVIPPGWSLLPLQRIDAPLGSTPPPQSSANGHPTEMNPPATQAGPSLGSNGAGSTGTTGMNGSSLLSTRQDEPSTSHSATLAADAAAAAPASTSEQTSSPPVVAPNPVLPSWGGPAQLFDDQRGASTPDLPESTGPKPTSVEAPTEAVGDEITETETGESSKGKAKAVTAEEADGEEH